jgi:hypothetical protein
MWCKEKKLNTMILILFCILLWWEITSVYCPYCYTVSITFTEVRNSVLWAKGQHKRQIKVLKCLPLLHCAKEGKSSGYEYDIRLITTVPETFNEMLSAFIIRMHKLNTKALCSNCMVTSHATVGCFLINSISFNNKTHTKMCKSLYIPLLYQYSISIHYCVPGARRPCNGCKRHLHLQIK